MLYNIANLSLKSLEKIFLVLDDLRFNIEIQNKTKWLNMGQLEGIEGVSKMEHRRIIQSLQKNTDFLLETPYTVGDYCFNVEVGKFNRFLQDVSDEILKLQNNEAVKRNRSEKGVVFDEITSILSIDGYKVKIDIRGTKTVAHEILAYIFIDNHDNLSDDFYYAEIAFSRFEDEEYSSNSIAWRKYHAACMDIQDKIRKQTANKINDFLNYNARQEGCVKINKKYLK